MQIESCLDVLTTKLAPSVHILACGIQLGKVGETQEMACHNDAFMVWRRTR